MSSRGKKQNGSAPGAGHAAPLTEMIAPSNCAPPASASMAVGSPTIHDIASDPRFVELVNTFATGILTLSNNTGVDPSFMWALANGIYQAKCASALEVPSSQVNAPVKSALDHPSSASSPLARESLVLPGGSKRRRSVALALAPATREGMPAPTQQESVDAESVTGNSTVANKRTRRGSILASPGHAGEGVASQASAKVEARADVVPERYPSRMRKDAHIKEVEALNKRQIAESKRNEGSGKKKGKGGEIAAATELAIGAPAPGSDPSPSPAPPPVLTVLAVGSASAMAVDEDSTIRPEKGVQDAIAAAAKPAISRAGSRLRGAKPAAAAAAAAVSPPENVARAASIVGGGNSKRKRTPSSPVVATSAALDATAEAAGLVTPARRGRRASAISAATASDRSGPAAGGADGSASVGEDGLSSPTGLLTFSRGSSRLRFTASAMAAAKATTEGVPNSDTVQATAMPSTVQAVTRLRLVIPKPVPAIHATAASAPAPAKRKSVAKAGVILPPPMLGDAVSAVGASTLAQFHLRQHGQLQGEESELVQPVSLPTPASGSGSRKSQSASKAAACALAAVETAASPPVPAVAPPTSAGRSRKSTTAADTEGASGGAAGGAPVGTVGTVVAVKVAEKSAGRAKGGRVRVLPTGAGAAPDNNTVHDLTLSQDSHERSEGEDIRVDILGLALRGTEVLLPPSVHPIGPSASGQRQGVLVRDPGPTYFHPYHGSVRARMLGLVQDVPSLAEIGTILGSQGGRGSSGSSRKYAHAGAFWEGESSPVPTAGSLSRDASLYVAETPLARLALPMHLPALVMPFAQPTMTAAAGAGAEAARTLTLTRDELQLIALLVGAGLSSRYNRAQDDTEEIDTEMVVAGAFLNGQPLPQGLLAPPSTEVDTARSNAYVARDAALGGLPLPGQAGYPFNFPYPYPDPDIMLPLSSTLPQVFSHDVDRNGCVEAEAGTATMPAGPGAMDVAAGCDVPDDEAPPNSSPTAPSSLPCSQMSQFSRAMGGSEAEHGLVPCTDCDASLILGEEGGRRKVQAEAGASLGSVQHGTRRGDGESGSMDEEMEAECVVGASVDEEEGRETVWDAGSSLLTASEAETPAEKSTPVQQSKTGRPSAGSAQPSGARTVYPRTCAEAVDRARANIADAEGVDSSLSHAQVLAQRCSVGVARLRSQEGFILVKPSVYAREARAGIRRLVQPPHEAVLERCMEFPPQQRKEGKGQEGEEPQAPRAMDRHVHGVATTAPIVGQSMGPAASPLRDPSARVASKSRDGAIGSNPILASTWFFEDRPQSFRLIVMPEVSAAMDCHAAMTDVEVIGTLWGTALRVRASAVRAALRALGLGGGSGPEHEHRRGQSEADVPDTSVLVVSCALPTHTGEEHFNGKEVGGGRVSAIMCSMAQFHAAQAVGACMNPRLQAVEEAGRAAVLDALRAVGVGASSTPPPVLPPPLVWVGWYHSHPSFAPCPSIVDCFSHRDQQAQAQAQALEQGQREQSTAASDTDAIEIDGDTLGVVAEAHVGQATVHSTDGVDTGAGGGSLREGDAAVTARLAALAASVYGGGGDTGLPVSVPFVGAIVSPYLTPSPGPCSVSTWFHTIDAPEGTGRGLPYIGRAGVQYGCGVVGQSSRGHPTLTHTPGVAGVGDKARRRCGGANDETFKPHPLPASLLPLFLPRPRAGGPRQMDQGGVEASLSAYVAPPLPPSKVERVWYLTDGQGGEADCPRMPPLDCIRVAAACEAAIARALAEEGSSVPDWPLGGSPHGILVAPPPAAPYRARLDSADTVPGQGKTGGEEGNPLAGRHTNGSVGEVRVALPASGLPVMKAYGAAFLPVPHAAHAAHATALIPLEALSIPVRYLAHHHHRSTLSLAGRARAAGLTLLMSREKGRGQCDRDRCLLRSMGGEGAGGEGGPKRRALARLGGTDDVGWPGVYMSKEGPPKEADYTGKRCRDIAALLQRAVDAEAELRSRAAQLGEADRLALLATVHAESIAVDPRSSSRGMLVDAPLGKLKPHELAALASVRTFAAAARSLSSLFPALYPHMRGSGGGRSEVRGPGARSGRDSHGWERGDDLAVTAAALSRHVLSHLILARYGAAASAAIAACIDVIEYYRCWGCKRVDLLSLGRDGGREAAGQPASSTSSRAFGLAYGPHGGRQVVYADKLMSALRPHIALLPLSPVRLAGGGLAGPSEVRRSLLRDLRGYIQLAWATA